MPLDQQTIVGPFTVRGDIENPVGLRRYSEESLVNFVSDRVARAFQSKSYMDMAAAFDRNERAYDGRFRNTDVPKWRSQAYVRTAFQLVEVQKAYMFDAIFGKYPYVMVVPQSVKYRDTAPFMEAKMNHDYNRMHYAKKFWDNFNYSVKHGVAITRRFWNFKLNYRPKRLYVRDKNGMPVPTARMSEEPYIEFDNPDFNIVDPRRVSWDPEGEYHGNMDVRYVVEEYVQDLDYLWTNRKRFGLINLEKLMTGDNPGYEIMRSAAVREEMSNNLQSGDPMRKDVVIDEYIGRVDMPGNQVDPRWYSIMVANNSILIRPPMPVEGNPYDVYNMIEKERTMRGVSPISVLMTDIDIINTLVNMRLDGMNYLINPRLMIWKGALADGTDISRIAPGQEIQVKHGYDMGKVAQFLQPQDFGRLPFNDQLDYHQQHMEKTISLTPQWSGASGGTIRSATEVNQTMERANSRFKAMVNAWRETGYRSFVEGTGKAIIYNMTDDQIMPVYDGNWKPVRNFFLNIAPAMVQGEFLYQYQDNLDLNKDLEIQHWNNLLTTFNNIWDKLPDVRVQMIVKEILRADPMGKTLDLDKMFPAQPTPQEAEILNNENSALASALGTQPGGQPPVAAEAAPAPGQGSAQQVISAMMAKGGK